MPPEQGGERMSVLLRIKLTALLMLLCLAGAAIASGPATDIVYRPDSVTLSPYGAYSRVRLPETSEVNVPGEPALPVTYLQFVIPSDSRVDDVSFSAEEMDLPGTHRVLPAQVEAPLGETAAWTDEDPGIYGSDEPFPPARIEYLGDGYLGGYRIASVAVYPLQYLPRSGRLSLATDISVELVLAPGESRAQGRGRMTADSAELYTRLVSTIVENPEDVPRRLPGVDVVDEAGAGGFQPRYTPSLEGSPVEYVIITGDEFVPYFQPLADWKTQKGVPTAIRTVSWIEANYPGGSDTAERIRFFIKDAYESWGTTYVLIGGDTNVVPVRLAWSMYNGGRSIATDLYYSDLDGNWDLDGDSKFGESYEGVSSPGDSVDLYPDVFVGRAPAATVLEAETFVDKILAYEKAPDATFAARNLYMAEVLFPYDWQSGEPIITDGAAHVVEPVLDLIYPNIHVVRLYQNYEEFPGSYPLSAEAAIDSLNRGYNISAHVGHGSKDILRAGWNDYISVQDVDGLSNGLDSSGFLWMLNCSATAIDSDCISEHFMNNPNGGSTYLYGSTRFCFPTTLDEYFYTWHELMYGGVERAGTVCALTKVPYVAESSLDNTDRFTQMSYLLLGDPESRLWTASPQTISALVDSVVPLGPTDLEVTVLDSAAVDSALVCVTMGDEVYATALTDASGVAHLTFTPASAGTLSLTITARNHYPHEGTVTVSPVSEAHLTLVSASVDDDAVGSSDGNGNGQAEAGETVEVDVTVANGGLADALGVTATLSADDPCVTVVDGAETLGVIPASGQVTSDAAFSVAIADTTPNDRDVLLTLSMSEAGSGSWTDEYTMRVFRPDLVQVHNGYDDGNDGVPDVGDTVTIAVEVLNDGNGDADLVTGVLRYPNAQVTVIDSTETWGDIPAGDSVTGQSHFVVAVDSVMTADFLLDITDEDGKVWSRHFDVLPPAQPQQLDGRVKATTIFLSWSPSEEADLWGYNVYRTDDSLGTYQKANSAVVEQIAYYEDKYLAEEQLYYYRVTAVDSSGNEGPPSATLWISTNPPAQFGWPLLGGEAMYGTPALVDVDGDDDLEVLVGSGKLYGWHDNGVEITDGDGDPRTEGVLADEGTGGFRSSIAVGELDGDPGVEIVGAAWGDVGTEDPLYEIWAWNAEDGTVVNSGGRLWPLTTPKFCWATPALTDLDHDGLDDIVIVCADGWIYAWYADGTPVVDADGRFAYLGASWTYGSPLAVDLDQTGDTEILAPGRDGYLYCFNDDGTAHSNWPVYLGGLAASSPCAGDVDNDGDIEVVATDNATNRVFVIDAAGNVLPNWPKTVVQSGDFPPSPTLADLDGNGDLEIIQPGSDGEVHVFNWQGDYLSGWPRSMGGACRSSAAVADVGGPPGLEIVVGCDNGKVYAYNTSGEIVPGWPIQLDDAVVSTPTVGDLDLDGDNEVVVSGLDGTVYVWDCSGEFAGGDGVEWASFRHDYHRTGYYGFVPGTGLPEEQPWEGTEAHLWQNVPNPFNPVTTIRYEVPEFGGRVKLSVYDVSGRLVRTLVDGVVEPGRRSAVWDGKDSKGADVASGIYYCRLKTRNGEDSIKLTLLK
jgi:hypothetical protein